MFILYEQSDNSVAIINFLEEYNVKHVIRSQVPKNARYVLIEDDKLPKEEDLSDFGKALRVDFDTKEIFFDIQVSREVTKDRLRKERIPFFEINDIKIRDAMLDGNNDELSKAIIERNRLRDITKLPDQVFTLDGLRQIHP